MVESVFIKKVKNLEIQGSVNIALHSLRYLKRFAKEKGFGKAFGAECKKILKARPTAVPVFNVINELKQERSFQKIDKMIKVIENSESSVAGNGKTIFKKKSVVMTHCHSHEVIYVLRASKRKIENVYVTETEPKEQGLLTAKDLKKAKIPFTFIIDSASAFYMPKTDMVIVGSDALRKKGFVNKIGTLPIAEVAHDFKKPVYVVASTLKLDKRKSIKIEMRDPDEVSKKQMRIKNPAFDITPWKYVSKIITEKGIFKPREIVRMIK